MLENRSEVNISVLSDHTLIKCKAKTKKKSLKSPIFTNVLQHLQMLCFKATIKSRQLDVKQMKTSRNFNGVHMI